MAREFDTISDSATYFKKATHVTPVKYAIELAALGTWGRNQYMGGAAFGFGIDCSTAGDKDLKPVSLSFLIDNTSSQISNSASVVVRARYYLRVTNAAITVTPKIIKSTDDITYSAATISGQLACSATATDYSGTNSKQTITLTLDAALRYYKAQVTVAGTPAAGYEGFVYCLFDCFCNV